MKRPRTYYGFEKDGKFCVSLFDKTVASRSFNTFDSKEEAEQKSIAARADSRGTPKIIWED